MASTGRRGLFERITETRNGLGLMFMLPAAVFLLCFLTYPLGLGVWLGFTDTKIGRAGIFVGLENYFWLADDPVFWLSVFNTLFYTIVASVMKFGLGLWLAVLLNQNLRFKNFFRADRSFCPTSCPPSCRRWPSGGFSTASSRSSPGS